MPRVDSMFAWREGLKHPMQLGAYRSQSSLRLSRKLTKSEMEAGNASITSFVPIALTTQ